MTSAEREPILGIRGLSSQWGLGPRTLGRGQGTASPEANDILYNET
jgi:hypothetical protein